ncbi:hypothetical protein SAMN06265379_103441 [Saccharicrinis carchari]|uniref:Uncharacterized protein n=1 Tax=Saccharicrinis carchari TaxID=1168039 RepID=A0A521CSR6_SACCC|nr:hypothetical protein [Saccharicrinis carchari]SMO62466.1 hypothetical protein SAMN06265379_103441 [Saccharicrinis carchari]
MPYRRLPNTDMARLRALKAAFEKGKANYPYNIAYAQKLYHKIQGVLPQFEQAVSQYNYSKERQITCSKQMLEHFKAARLYVSHFIQVLNFCIIRNEMKPAVRKYFGLSINDKTVPDLSTEQQLMIWGKRIIEGEQKRTMEGGSRIYNPSIAMVRIKFEKFLEYYNNHKDLVGTTQKMHEKVQQMRDNVDVLIVKLWNGVEENYNHLNPTEKRQACTEYGVVYVTRSDEKVKPE